MFSQDRANSVGAAEALALSVLVYFALRVLLRAPLRAAWLAALVGLRGAWLASIGINEFADGAGQLATVGLTDLVAFRSRFIHPIPGWVPGECFTALELMLPFACAAGVYAWKKTQSRLAVLTLLPAAPIIAALLLSLSRAVFWSTILFFAAACGLMAAYRVIALRTASFLNLGTWGAWDGRDVPSSFSRSPASLVCSANPRMDSSGPQWTRGMRSPSLARC
jgi:hypothetical protein